MQVRIFFVWAGEALGMPPPTARSVAPVSKILDYFKFLITVAEDTI